LCHRRETRRLLRRRYDPFGGRCTAVRRERRDPRVGRRAGGVHKGDRGRRGEHLCSRRATIEEGFFRRSAASRDRRAHSSMGGVDRVCVSTLVFCRKRVAFSAEYWSLSLVAPRNASRASPRFGNAPRFLAVKCVTSVVEARLWFRFSLKCVAPLAGSSAAPLLPASRHALSARI
jgi:hypothetical protein